MLTVAVNVTVAPTRLGFILETSASVVGVMSSTVPERLMTGGVDPATELTVMDPRTGLPVTFGANDAPMLQVLAEGTSALAVQVVIPTSSAAFTRVGWLRMRSELPSFASTTRCGSETFPTFIVAYCSESASALIRRIRL